MARDPRLPITALAIAMFGSVWSALAISTGAPAISLIGLVSILFIGPAPATPRGARPGRDREPGLLALMNLDVLRTIRSGYRTRIVQRTKAKNRRISGSRGI
jgi:hypothetical protein